MIAAYLLIDKSGARYDMHFMPGMLLVGLQIDPICMEKQITRYEYFRAILDEWAEQVKIDSCFKPDLIGIDESEMMKVLASPMTYRPKPNRSPDWAVDLSILIDRDQKKVFRRHANKWESYDTIKENER